MSARLAIRRLRPAYLWIWLVFAGLAIATLSARGIYLNRYAHDIFVVLDGIKRTYAGDIPHVDYHTPVGLGYVWPILVLRLIEPFSLLTILHANLLVAFVLLAVATATLMRRFSPYLFFMATFGIVATVLSPRAADTVLNVFSHLAPYNRWCEGAAMLVAALALVRPAGLDRPRAIDWPAGIAIGALVAFIAYVKVTFGVGAAGLVAVGLVFRQLSVRTAAIGVATALVLVLWVQLGWHDNQAYVADLVMAKSAIAEIYGGLSMQNRRDSFLLGLLYGGLIALLLLVRQGNWDGFDGYFRRWWRVLALSAAAVIGAVVMNTQLHTQHEIPLLFTVLLVAAEHARRVPSLADRRPAKFIALTLVTVAAGAVPLLDAAAVPIHAAMTRSGTVCPVPALQGTPMGLLLFDRAAFPATPPGASDTCPFRVVDPVPTQNPTVLEIGRLTEAMQMLRPLVKPGNVILTLDFSNPYPVVFDNPFPSGAITWWHFGRTYGRQAHPDAARLLDHTDYVLQSVFDTQIRFHGAEAWAVYGAAVEQRFVPVAQGRLWRLWARKPQSSAVPEHRP